MRRPRVLSALVATVVGAALLGACSGGDDGYRMTAYFDSGISLYTGGEVRVLGLPAGEITDVDAEPNRVRVEMRIRDDVPVPADAQATIVPLSLIGERYVQLFPAWTTGTERAADGAVIPQERTGVPVEPDEALAALKEFLDTLDPQATGRLVENLADDLDGNGAALNSALKGLSDLTVTLAAKDDELAALVDNFDQFTATLVTREQQLGEVLDGFATTAAVLAQERRDIERLVRALSSVSADGVDLVAEHRVRLGRDLEVLARTLDSVRTNIDIVRELLAAAPMMVAGEDLDANNEGLIAAYDPQHHRIDLRDALSPLASDLLGVIGIGDGGDGGGGDGGGGLCIPGDVSCPPGDTPLPSVPPPTAPPLPAPVPIPSPLPSPTVPGAATPKISGAAPADRDESPRAKGVVGWFAALGREIAEVLA